MAASLSPRERIERALEFRETDVVPTGEIIQNGDLVSLFAGRQVREDWTLEELAATYRGLEIDLGMLMAPASVPRLEKRHGVSFQVSYWSEWVAGRPFADVAGLKEFLAGIAAEIRASAPEDLWTYAGKGGIVGQAIGSYGRYFDQLKAAVAPTIPCHIESPVGLDLVYNLAGWELFSYLLADDPGVISETFEELARHEVERVHRVADPQISPVVVVYCDIASVNDVIFSPAFLRAEFFPRLRRLVDAWHEHRVKVIYHSEGNLKKVLDDLVACGIDGLNPLEPENLSLSYVRERHPRLALWGGIDDKKLLPFGTPAEVEEAVRQAIDVCRDGGLILGAAGEIHPAVKPENAAALFRAAKRFSRKGEGT